MKHDFVTVGGATEDITFYTKEGVLFDNHKDVLRQKLIAFEYGAKIRIDKAHSTFGGGAANAAVCLSRLGFRVASAVAVGQDIRGEKVVNNLSQQGVDVEYVQKEKDTESGFSFILMGPGHEHVVFSNRAANKKLSPEKKRLNAISRAKWVYMTSLSGEWKQVLKNIFSVNGPKIAWNPGHIQLNAGLGVLGKYLKLTSMLCVNKDEALELVVSDKKYKNKDSGFLNNANNLLKILKEWVPGVLVITSGKDGADAFDGENFYHQDIITEKRRVDTTGVGDAFGSTFTAGLELFGGDIEKAMYLGVKNTASVIGEQGAQNGLLEKKDLPKYLQKKIKV